ncbi:polyprenyl synthetase family protein [Nocardioides oleivorans]|uniref:Polyprenyl synthetase family protein n=1 Tax=Nocardioides oleivorans TaxID=273676 RepID=A0A4V1RKB4_9ACTN|nr:polyprenyl synthetase family protein [Nocardioides oleivorans]RYB91692.1 polyprenyl synthetase family protein [Nocardioides oleivorans]
MLEIDADAVLRRLTEQGRARAAAVDRHHLLLWDALDLALQGGKRFRPRLVMATHDALGGVRPGAAAEVGAAIEMLHTAFVIHDDVIDDDHVRRGRPNVSGTFRADATSSGAGALAAGGYGLAAAVLAGDLALAAALRTVATCDAPPDVVHGLLDLFDLALHTTAAGELADVRLALGTAAVTLDESLQMEELKTSAYSFALPLQAGSVLAGAEPPTTTRLGEAGRSLGLAFQLVDDLIGVFGDPEQSGKSATGDLRTGKQTPLLVHARSTPQWEAISSFVGRDLETAELDDVRDLLASSGSRAFVETLVEEHLVAAREVLADMGVSLDFVDELMARPPLVVAGQGTAA